MEELFLLFLTPKFNLEKSKDYYKNIVFHWFLHSWASAPWKTIHFFESQGKMFEVWLLNRIIFYKTNMDWIKPINAFFFNFNGCKTKIEWISDLNNFCWRSSIYLNKKVPTNWRSNIALEFHELSVFFVLFLFVVCLLGQKMKLIWERFNVSFRCKNKRVSISQ